MQKAKPEYGVPAAEAQRSEMQQAVAAYATQHRLVPPLSMEELRDHASRLTSQSSLLDYAMVLLNNEVWRETVASIPYSRRLLLLPQCLRNFADCPATLDEFGLLCEECGRCNIGELQALAEDLGYVVLVAEGSTVVSKLLAGGKVDAVVGVSCLNALEKSFPHMADGAIPGLAIPLTLDGCINTTTDFGHVREAIRLKSSVPWKNQVDTEAIRKIVDGWFDEPFDCATETERIAYDWLLKDGKRWRPFLLACTYSALNEGSSDFPADVRKLAIAVECFHKASLIHDDIEDHDDLRYGQPTLHRQYGIPVAINAGDLLVGEGYRWIAEVENSAAALLRIASANHRTLCVGQGEELIGTERNHPLTAQQVIEIARRKTAPAFGVSLLLGAVAANADQALLDALHTFSESLGIAYQIRDDLEEYTSGQAADLRASIILALAEGSERFYRHFSDDEKSVLTPQVRNRLDELMVVEKASQLLEHYKNEAVRALNPLQSAMLKTLLRRVAAKMLDLF
ncbi:Hexaprenyl-diphosphate synthase large subunit ((2E,6E)-farnesyl-diphosphate specific) [Pontiella desulfatans]|uniref:Hexaprenyl-diphosphate synthase large subunit ((2E,6E)-farnesyl-diphosphate specific) n=1 Tax=Pontiella desulfatans TaxID=2750659 RepID=A0A6C2UBI8_PONDE|nr:polyprenyl synthetase family protein [Pontiella desulfatans]VGO17518.1 Hexaprenyl-diphosphate synthase large subunit ((2E,6E)-farnesyl-diphosphate specific) [Pontiella desulfatans]